MKLAKLGDIGRIFNGDSISSAEKDRIYRGADGLPYIGTAEVGFDTEIDYDSGVAIPKDRQVMFKIAKAGTPLVCAEGGSAGRKVGYLDRPVCFGNKLFAVETQSGCEGKFLFYFFQSDNFLTQFRSLTTGLIGGVSIKKFKEILVPLVPLEEQRRIVAVLDEAFAAIATATANAEKNLANARELLASSVTEIFSNVSLSAEMCALDELCEPNRVITYGVIKLGDHQADGVPCLRTSNVRWLRFDLEGMKFIREDLSREYKRTILRGGEVLVNVRGTLGGVAVAQSSMAGWNVSREVAVVPADGNLIDSDFLASWIGTTESQKWLTGVLKGAAYTGINITDLRSLPVPKIPMQAQKLLVQRLNDCLEEGRLLVHQYERRIEALASLKQAILHRAFTGDITATAPELVPA